MKQAKQFVVVFILLFVVSACAGVTVTTTNPSSNQGSSQGGSSSGASPTPKFGVQSKTSNCKALKGMPDSACTPGAVISTATKAKVCKSGYARSVRNVPTSVKNKAYSSYSITHHRTGQYEVDHLISLELGGSNDISNLWPELASPKPGFHEKDKVENYLHSQVCSGAISLQKAQVEIATDWLGVYNHLPANVKNKSASNDG